MAEYKSMLLMIIMASIIVMLASLAGVFSVWKRLGHIIEKNLSFLVSFSAGVFLLIALHLGFETIEHSNFYHAGFWILIGIFVMLILFKLLPGFHHHHDEGAESDHKHSHLDARRILISDGIHNIGDGILLTAGFLISIPAGIAVTTSIFIHELVQEVSEFFVLRQANYSSKKALLVNFAVSSTILIGALGSYFLLETFEMLEIPLLGFATGAFLVVVFNDLIPDSIRHSKIKAQYVKHILWFLIGFLVMFGVNSYLGHSHDDGHDHDHGVGHEEHENHEEDEDHHDEEHEDGEDHHEEEEGHND